MFPHRVHRAVGAADDAHDIDGLEVTAEHLEYVKTDRREPTAAILVADQPSQDASGLQGPMELLRNVLHHFEPPQRGRWDPPETGRVLAIPNVVRIWRGVAKKDERGGGRGGGGGGGASGR